MPPTAVPPLYFFSQTVGAPPFKGTLGGPIRQDIGGRHVASTMAWSNMWEILERRPWRRSFRLSSAHGYTMPIGARYSGGPSRVRGSFSNSPLLRRRASELPVLSASTQPAHSPPPFE